MLLDKHNEILVSVIIPTYNFAAYIADAVESALGQTYRNLEIIVVDDGSIDSTPAVLRPYYNRMVYLRQENRGVSAARNLGIRCARGEMIAFLDGDDIWLPDKVERQLGVMTTYSDIGLVFGDVELFNASGVVIPSFFREKSNAARLVSGDIVLKSPFQLLLGENFITTSTVIVRRLCLAEIGGFDESLRSVEDKDLWLRIATAYPFACMPDILGRKRVHDNNLSSDHRLAAGDALKSMAKISALLSSTQADAHSAIRSREAGLYFDLGYAYFEENDYRKARENFKLSLSKKLGAKAALYYFSTIFSTMLGKSLAAIARKLKRGIRKTTICN